MTATLVPTRRPPPAPRSLRPRPPLALRYGGYQWTLLLDEDPQVVVGAIDAPEVARFLCWDGEADVRQAVVKRWRRDLAGEAITFVARREGRVDGWAGLLISDEFGGVLQTSTFLHPSAWGSGLNLRSKHLQWAIADLLGHGRMLLEIAGDNLRSQSAAWKLFPNGKVLLLASASEPEAALVLAVDEPPVLGARPTEVQRARLASMLERHPGWRIWRAVSPGPLLDTGEPR
jgi:hypothetical protein